MRGDRVIGIYFFLNSTAKNYNSSVFEFEPKTRIHDNFEKYLSFKTLSSSAWQSTTDLKVSFNILISDLREKLFKNATSLGEITKSVRGILANEEDVSAEKLGEQYKPFFAGKLNRYITEKPEQFVKFGDNLRERPKDYDFFTGERILVRRIVSRQFRVISQLVDAEFVSKKDFYIFKTTDKKFSIRYLLGILNSTLVSYLKTKGDFCLQNGRGPYTSFRKNSDSPLSTTPATSSTICTRRVLTIGLFMF